MKNDSFACSVRWNLPVAVFLGLALACSGSEEGPGGGAPGVGGSAGGGEGGGGSGGLAGSGGTGNVDGCPEDAPVVPGPEDPAVSSGRFLQIGVGGFSCGIDDAHHLACWGEIPFSIEPPEGEFRKVSVGSCQACALDMAGTIQCWGCPPGDGGIEPPAGQFSALAMGFDHLCAVRSGDGRVVCSARGDLGTLPEGSFEALVSGMGSSCGIVRGSGSAANVRCWGRNDFGQATPPSVAAEVLGGGAYHSCAIEGDGDLVCWGRNDHGQADPPSGQFRAVDETCALRKTGEAVCWGASTSEGVPSGCYLKLDASSTHACAIRHDGHVVCWGSNHGGESTPP